MTEQSDKPKKKQIGGKRPGAGRPKGALSRIAQETREAAKATGELPIDYMLRVMRDEGAATERRDDMAKAAAPYLHPKISSVEATIDARLTHEQALKELGS